MLITTLGTPGSGMTYQEQVRLSFLGALDTCKVCGRVCKIVNVNEGTNCKTCLNWSAGFGVFS